MFRKLKRYLRDPYYEVGKVLLNTHPNWMYDKWWISTLFQQIFGYKLDWNNPQTFNEKLQWLKIHDRNPLYSTLVDKYAVKQWAADKIGTEYIIPTLAVYKTADEIDLDKLPDQFVLKCNHDSSSIIICKNKSEFDLKLAKERLSKSLKTNYYTNSREWPYKNVKPLIIAEPYLEDEHTHDLPDYKFFCFDGEVKALFVATDRQSESEETKFDFYDANYKHIDVTNGHPNAYQSIEKPKEFEKMKALAAELSKGMPHVRCDFYWVNGKIYFGEITFYHWSGFVPFDPPEFDKIMGDWLDLKKAK